MNKLGGRKTHHGFQMHSLGSETLASVFLTTEGLLTVNMFKLWSGSTVLIDTVLIRAFQECLWLGWHRWLFANIANNHRQNHTDITAGRLVTGSWPADSDRQQGVLKPYGVVRNQMVASQAWGRNASQFSWNTASTVLSGVNDWERTVACNSQPAMQKSGTADSSWGDSDLTGTEGDDVRLLTNMLRAVSSPSTAWLCV